VALSRRKFLGLLGGAVAAGAVGAGSVGGLDGGLRHRLEDKWAYIDGLTFSLPASGAAVPSPGHPSRAGSCAARWAGLLATCQGRPESHRAQPVREGS